MLNLLAVILQDVDTTGSSAAAGGAAVLVMILWFAVIALMVAAMWKVFTKAGKPGWAAIVPIYNIIVLLQIAGKPTWWIVLFLIPIVSLIFAILTYVALAEALDCPLATADLRLTRARGPRCKIIATLS